MPFLIDGILVAVAVVFALIGLRKGFVKSLLGLVAAVIALIAAFFAARYLAQWLYDLSVRSVVLSFVETKLQEMHIDSAASEVAAVFVGRQRKHPAFFSGKCFREIGGNHCERLSAADLECVDDYLGNPAVHPLSDRVAAVDSPAEPWHKIADC